MALQITMVIPDRLPEASVAPVSGVEAVGGEGKGFAEGGEGWDERDLAALMMRMPTSVKTSGRLSWRP
jgi:hypothetical protein